MTPAQLFQYDTRMVSPPSHLPTHTHTLPRTLLKAWWSPPLSQAPALGQIPQPISKMGLTAHSHPTCKDLEIDGKGRALGTQLRKPRLPAPCSEEQDVEAVGSTGWAGPMGPLLGPRVEPEPRQTLAPTKPFASTLTLQLAAPLLLPGWNHRAVAGCPGSAES